MAAAGLAARLADEIGTTTDDAARWVDELGSSRAARVADGAADEGGQMVGDWWKPAAALGGLGGGGALLWRQQGIEAAKNATDQQQTYSEAVQSIMNSDGLTPEQKQDMLDQILENFPDGDDNGSSDWNPLKGLQDALGLGSAQSTIILVIVMAIVLQQVLSEGE